MKNKFDLFALFENKRFLMVFAVLVSLLLYIAVALTKGESTNYKVSNVPINLDLQASNLTNPRLNVIEGDEYYTDVTINLPRTLWGRYNANSAELATTADISAITGPGTYSVPVISAAADSENLPFSIVSYSPRSIQVRVDRLKTTTFDIDIVTKGVSVPPNYVLDGEKSSPETVSISGPEAEIAKIRSVEISLDLETPLTQTHAVTLPIVLKDAVGEVIDPDEHHLKMDTTEAQLVITVLKETGVPLEVGFRNVPRDFPLEKLEEIMTVTPDYARIGGRDAVIDRLTEIRVGYIDIKELRPGSNSFNFTLQMGDVSDEVKLLENIANVTVTFDDFNWDTQVFHQADIQMLNEPRGYNVRLLSTTQDNIQLVGDKNILESLTSDDIVVELDLFDRELSTGQRSLPVKISVPDKGLVWALGSYDTVVEITEKE